MSIGLWRLASQSGSSYEGCCSRGRQIILTTWCPLTCADIALYTGLQHFASTEMPPPQSESNLCLSAQQPSTIVREPLQQLMDAVTKPIVCTLIGSNGICQWQLEPLFLWNEWKRVLNFTLRQMQSKYRRPCMRWCWICKGSCRNLAVEATEQEIF